MFIEWVLLGKVLKLYLVHKSKNRDFHNASLQNALTRNLGQRLNTHSVSQGHILVYLKVTVSHATRRVAHLSLLELLWMYGARHQPLTAVSSLAVKSEEDVRVRVRARLRAGKHEHTVPQHCSKHTKHFNGGIYDTMSCKLFLFPLLSTSSATL